MLYPPEKTWIRRWPQMPRVNEKLDSLKGSQIVSKFSNAGTILISDSIQRIRIQRWKNYWTDEKRSTVEKLLTVTGAKYGFNKEAFLPFHQFITSDFQPLDISRFDPVRNLFLNDMITEMPGLTMVISIVKMKNSQSPPGIYPLFGTKKYHCDRQAGNNLRIC